MIYNIKINKIMETQKNKGGRPLTGTKRKFNKAFTLDPDTYESFRLYCKMNDLSMSKLIEEFMKQMVNMERSTFLIKNNDN